MHADEEMDNNALNIFDLEHCVLRGKIIERQKDKNTGEWKYKIRGRAFIDSKSHGHCSLKQLSYRPNIRGTQYIIFIFGTANEKYY
ncbi:MAG: DUF4258 domain-containing protein [bacterium]